MKMPKLDKKIARQVEDEVEKKKIKERETIRGELDIPKLSIYEYLYTSIGEDKDLYALNYFDKRITYYEMFRNINLIAKSLKYLGVKKREIVTICMPNTPEAVLMFYATSKIGAVADMIHPLSAKEEIKNYLCESHSRTLLLYDEDYAKVKDIIDDTHLQHIILASVSESMPMLTKMAYKLTRGHRVSWPKEENKYLEWKEFLDLGYLYRGSVQTKVDPKSPAVILHSGGTTGTPKGIVLDDTSFNALAKQGRINVINVEARDKIVTVIPIFHGFGLGVCLHCPLTIKVEVILMPEFEAKRFAKMINKYGPQVLAGVPTLWEAMLSNKAFRSVDLSSLKYMISGGDSLSVSAEEKINDFLQSHGANIVISKGYGMTESLAATIFTFPDVNVPGSIGVPMVGNSAIICDIETKKEKPPYEEGEICVCGPTIMMEYYKRPRETAEVLKKHSDGRIWLHTGDLGYKDEKGRFYFTTRLKRVIISSGFNIYPTQIEGVLERHPKVAMCTVIGKPHPYKMQVAKAFIVLKRGCVSNTKLVAELRLLCKESLPAFSIPKEFVFREDLPKTAYGKVDYKKLEKEELEAYEQNKKK